MANSGGGVILLGLNDDGTPSGRDIEPALRVDPADVVNQIHKYTGVQFPGVEIFRAQKGTSSVCALSVAGSRIPIAFSRVGEYEPAPGKKKTEFALGTVYFRHGPKSEPGSTEDMRLAIEREVELVRRSWLDGIAKVVEAPAGARIQVIAPQATEDNASAKGLRLTTDEGAPAYFAIPLDTTHPHRQKELVQELNKKLAGKKAVTGHDIQCVRRVHKTDNNVQFCFKQRFSSNRYSDAFVQWLLEMYMQDEMFFAKARAADPQGKQ